MKKEKYTADTRAFQPTRQKYEAPCHTKKHDFYHDPSSPQSPPPPPPPDSPSQISLETIGREFRDCEESWTSESSFEDFDAVLYQTNANKRKGIHFSGGKTMYKNEDNTNKEERKTSRPGLAKHASFVGKYTESDEFLGTEDEGNVNGRDFTIDSLIQKWIPTMVETENDDFAVDGEGNSGKPCISTGRNDMKLLGKRIDRFRWSDNREDDDNMTWVQTRNQRLEGNQCDVSLKTDGVCRLSWTA